MVSSRAHLQNTVLYWTPLQSPDDQKARIIDIIIDELQNVHHPNRESASREIPPLIQNSQSRSASIFTMHARQRSFATTVKQSWSATIVRRAPQWVDTFSASLLPAYRQFHFKRLRTRNKG